MGYIFEGMDTTPVSTRQMRRSDASGTLYYEMEYIIELPGRFRRHNISCYAVRCVLLLQGLHVWQFRRVKTCTKCMLGDLYMPRYKKARRPYGGT